MAEVGLARCRPMSKRPQTWASQLAWLPSQRAPARRRASAERRALGL